jgi:hypothetical protein
VDHILTSSCLWTSIECLVFRMLAYFTQCFCQTYSCGLRNSFAACAFDEIWNDAYVARSVSQSPWMVVEGTSS